ncbi:hypothetical protein RCH10_005488, partial [Variovorax sp. GrIS 2.14]|uniref:hypothetical protein n=1 Tax=Variovorax sp. GrIS 2.14 TaxID=3071709 RepID=UPI0038F5EA5C
NAAECVRRGLLLIFAPVFTGEVLASRSSFHTYRVVQISGASSLSLLELTGLAQFNFECFLKGL